MFRSRVREQLVTHLCLAVPEQSVQSWALRGFWWVSVCTAGRLRVHKNGEVPLARQLLRIAAGMFRTA